jgi:hypothetical protein
MVNGDTMFGPRVRARTPPALLIFYKWILFARSFAGEIIQEISRNVLSVEPAQSLFKEGLSTIVRGTSFWSSGNIKVLICGELLVANQINARVPKGSEEIQYAFFWFDGFSKLVRRHDHDDGLAVPGDGLRSFCFGQPHDLAKLIFCVS